MLKKQFYTIIKRFGIWRTIQGMLVTCILLLLCTALIQMVVPVSLQDYGIKSNVISDMNTADSLLQSPQASIKSNSPDMLTFNYRAGLFESAMVLQDKPMADKTIERIKEQLKLQCVMEINNQLVAYINIKGIGLKKCSIGDSVYDLFNVLDINKQNKSVVISIVDHKVTLHL
jgi:hypothetical protein